MTAEWSRPCWQPTGRPASLFYVVPGRLAAAGLQLSRSRHHIPPGLQVSAHKRSDNPAWLDGFFGKPGLGSDLGKVFGPRADKLRAVRRCVIAKGEFPDPSDLAYLRDSLGIVSAVLDQGGLGVLDLFAIRWWSKEEWMERFV